MKLAPMIECFCKCIDDISLQNVENAARLLLDTKKKDRSVFVCGNGGSGSNANLFSSILSQKIVRRSSSGLCAFSLNTSMPLITSSAENMGYNKIFSSQIENIAHPSELLVCISGSGNSPNILEAVSTAKSLGMNIIGLTGMGGGKLSMIADIPIIVSSNNMEQIENVHTAIIYAITMWVTQNY